MKRQGPDEAMPPGAFRIHQAELLQASIRALRIRRSTSITYTWT